MLFDETVEVDIKLLSVINSPAVDETSVETLTQVINSYPS